MKPPVETIYDPAAVRRGNRVPSYIWTGIERGRTGRTLRPTGIKPNWHLIMTIAGRGSFRQPGMEHELLPGDMVLFTPDCYQDYGPVEGSTWDDLYAHFSPRPQWHPWMR